jgi:hypothetical protein
LGVIRQPFPRGRRRIRARERAQEITAVSAAPRGFQR